jgi:two-component system, response regulator PdtaR
MVILTVEDEFLISEYLRAILEGGGHTVIATFDADEAIKVLERVRDIELVITDIDMPGSMDGLRLAAAIRDRWPPIHLIVVTGFTPPSKSELPYDSLLSQSHMGRSKSSRPYDTSSKPPRQRRVLSAIRRRNLGKRRRHNGRCRRNLLALRKSIVRSKKTNRTIGKFFLVLGAPLRHIDDAPRNDLSHGAGVGGPGALASRLEEPLPGLIKGRREYRNSFGTKGRLGPDQIKNAGHARTPTPKPQACAAGSRREFHLWLR